jgi:hypothetical protein
MTAVQARVDAAKVLAAASITGTFAAIGTPIGHAYRILHMINNTNQDVWISFDGTTNNIYMPAGSFWIYDLQANAQQNANFNISLQTQIYVSAPGTLPTLGSVYVIGTYGKGE